MYCFTRPCVEIENSKSLRKLKRKTSTRRPNESRKYICSREWLECPGDLSVVSEQANTCSTLMKSYPKVIERILEEIRKHRTFCIVGHIRPDGDCVGSQLGLALALKNEGKKVVCWNEDKIPQKYEFLDPDHIIQRPKPGMRFDCVIATDAASFER